MCIGPLELSGTIGRTQDFAVIKQNEDNRGAVVQGTMVEAARKEEEQKANTVNRTDQAVNYEHRFDAKEEGKNQYTGDGGQNRKKEHEEGHNKDGKVTLKTASSFDIRI